MAEKEDERGLKRQDKDKKWEEVQIKAFRLWINSYLDKESLSVQDIREDLKDGVKLCRFLELATNKKLPRYSKKPAMRINMIENQGIFLTHVQSGMGIRLVGIGAEDLVDGHLKLTLGCLWSLFRKLRIDTIKDTATGKSSEDGLLSWLKKMTEGYPHVNITSFRESFNDGMAFSALIHAMDPEAIDFETLNPDNSEENLTNAFKIAEQKLGIPQLLEVEDLLSGNPDERSVVLYSSLFFHAYVADEEKRKLEAKKSSIANKVTDLEAKLASEAEQNEELRKLNEELEERQRRLQAELDAKSGAATGLEGEIEKLKEEIKYLRERAIMDAELRALLENKIGVLQCLLDESLSEMSESTSKMSAEMDEFKAREEALANERNRLEEERNKILTDAEEKQRRMKEMEERKAGLLAEIEALKERIQKEIQRRRDKTTEIERLKKEIETLKTKQIVQDKARIGLDVLKHNLEEHLEDLYRWRDLNEADFKEDLDDFDLNKVIAQLADKSFEEQLQVLDEKLQAENHSLQKIISAKDATKKLQDIVVKSGWLVMKGRKEWRKRWFRLTGDSLSYYEDDATNDVAGLIKLDAGCEVVRQKAVKEDENSNKKVWPLKLTVGDRKLFVRAATKKERHQWFLALTSAIAHLNYVQGCTNADIRPDTRLITLFSSGASPCLILDNRPLHATAIAALVKGLPGRDELEHVSLQNTDLDDAKLAQLCEVFEKMQLKSVNLSNNKLSNPTALLKALAFDRVTSLVLDGNTLGNEFATELSASVASSATLNVLSLNNNAIGAAGAEAFGKAISGGSLSVPHLALANNKLGDDGAKNISVVFSSNKSFTSANLSGNAIGNDGAAAIATSLHANTVLENLDLSNNNIGKEGAVELKSMMHKNRDIISVNLSANSIITGGVCGELFSSDGFAVPQLIIKRA